MGGRVAMTIDTPQSNPQLATMAVAATGGAGAKLVSARAFAVQSIWVSEAEVRAAPRTDGKPLHGW